MTAGEVIFFAVVAASPVLIYLGMCGLWRLLEEPKEKKPWHF